MVDMAQADKDLRNKQASANGIYMVCKLDGTLMANGLTWANAYKLVMANFDDAQMVRTGSL